MGVVMEYGNYANAVEYMAAWSGWQLDYIRKLRDSVLAAAPFDEAIKWGHLVYAHNGPVLLIRAMDDGVRLGFWRGQRLTGIEPRLVPGGKYEMATVEFHEGDRIDPEVVRRLALRARELNDQLGDPRDAAKR
jgi:hypothetical protein